MGVLDRTVKFSTPGDDGVRITGQESVIAGGRKETRRQDKRGAGGVCDQRMAHERALWKMRFQRILKGKLLS